MPAKCPGMNPENWKFDDIKQISCKKCGQPIEFWKDDVKIKCRKCGLYNFNPDLDNTCLSWCDKAVECIDNMDIDEWKKKQKYI